MSNPILRLNPKADYRLRHGHLWIYSNEIDNKITPLNAVKPGSTVVVEDAYGKSLGVAYINPNTLICGRIISHDLQQTFDQELLQERIRKALQLRQQIFAKDCYRLVYGESDGLPGLVVDRFFDVLVVQISTAGMELQVNNIISALDLELNPTTILLKNDHKMREVEGLPSYIEWRKGLAVDAVALEENDVQFMAPILQGQKTGWFYDHRLMRARLRDYVKDKRVLDVFSYVGGWGIQAAAFGAKEVVAIDSSAFALDYVKTNAQLNGLNNVSTMQGDAFDLMESLYNAGQRFDVVILDPPALIPRRKDFNKGFAAYQKANLAALRLLSDAGGFLVSGSCSMHLQASDLWTAISKAGLKLRKNLVVLEQGHQSPDHPIHAAIPETAYLKSIIVHCS